MITKNIIQKIYKPKVSFNLILLKLNTKNLTKLNIKNQKTYNELDKFQNTYI